MTNIMLNYQVIAFQEIRNIDMTKFLCNTLLLTHTITVKLLVVGQIDTIILHIICIFFIVIFNFQK